MRLCHQSDGNNVGVNSTVNNPYLALEEGKKYFNASKGQKSYQVPSPKKHPKDSEGLSTQHHEAHEYCVKRFRLV
jgi:hypothetical protein